MRAPAFVLGFHGCDEKTGEAILDGHKIVEVSEKDHHWLGAGAYFWENDPARALKWAEHIQKYPQGSRHTIDVPFVIGAIIDLGECLDLFNSECLEDVRLAHGVLEEMWAENPVIERPVNEPGHKNDVDFTKRFLDCAVLNATHQLAQRSGKPAYYDTVRGGFTEGQPLYEGAYIVDKTHVQICVRDPKVSIRAYFRLPDFPKRNPVFATEPPLSCAGGESTKTLQK